MQTSTSASLLIESGRRGVISLTLSRPDSRNALNEPLIDELTEAFAEVDASVTRVIVIAGAGPVFCAGADLDWLLSGGDAEGAKASVRLARLFTQIHRCPVPVVAKVGGSAFGGGLGLLAASDIVIADERAQFGLPETRFGLAPVTIAPYLVRKISATALSYLVLTGERIDAATAQSYGLLSRVAPIGTLDQHVDDVVEQLLRGGPLAQQAAKGLLRDLGEEPRYPGPDAVGIARLDRVLATGEVAEARAARSEGRESRWQSPQNRRRDAKATP